MRLLSIISTSVLALTIAAPVYAQQEQHDQKEEEKGKTAQENEKKEQPSKPAKQNEKNAQQQDKNNKQEEKSAQQQDKNNQQENKNAQQQNRNNQQEEKKVQQQHAQSAQHASGGRIPADRYQANFGRQHTFRVSQGDFRSGRFQYGGYWFGFGGAWPSNWLYTQDVYVIEIDGMYYLCNPMYPGVNLVINVTL
jgi:hypothetical protein